MMSDVPTWPRWVAADLIVSGVRADLPVPTTDRNDELGDTGRTATRPTDAERHFFECRESSRATSSTPSFELLERALSAPSSIATLQRAR